MKRPMGYRTIRCVHCNGKNRIWFRTLHRLKIEVERGDYRGESVPLSEAKEER